MKVYIHLSINLTYQADSATRDPNNSYLNTQLTKLAL